MSLCPSCGKRPISLKDWVAKLILAYGDASCSLSCIHCNTSLKCNLKTLLRSRKIPMFFFIMAIIAMIMSLPLYIVDIYHASSSSLFYLRIYTSAIKCLAWIYYAIWHMLTLLFLMYFFAYFLANFDIDKSKERK